MKILTLKQPWATLIAEGYKDYEFRSWKTNYRGKVYIHAGKGIDKIAMKNFAYLNLNYPSSKILAIATIKECVLIDDKFNEDINHKNSLVYINDKERTGYAWKLIDINKVNNSEHIKGKLGLWDI